MTRARLDEVIERADAGYWGTDPGGAEQDVRAIRNGDVLANGHVRWDQLPLRGLSTREVGKAAVAPGDIVLTTSGYCGQVAFIDRTVPEGLCVTNFVRALRPKRDLVEPRFLFWLLNSERFREMLQPFIRGTIMKNLSFGAASLELELPFPPIEEQRRIAAVLDQADQVRAKRQRSAALVESLAYACFVAAFGESSSELLTVPLGSLVVAGDRINYGVVQPGDDHAGGVALVRVSDLVGGVVSHAKLKRITPEIDANYRRSRLLGDEILISCVGSVGVVALSSERERGFNIARAVARIRLAPSLSREYVAAYLSTPPVQAVLRSELRTVAQPTLNIKQLAELPIPIPHADSQAQFERRIQAVRTVLRRAADHLSGLDSLFASLQQRAFAEAL